jgi:hypothetical protein
MRSATPSIAALDNVAEELLLAWSCCYHKSIPIALPEVSHLPAPTNIKPRPQPTSKTSSSPDQGTNLPW